MTNTIGNPPVSRAQNLPAEVARDVSVISVRHPRISETITKLWGSIVLHDYLNTLIFDDRGGRQGFAEPVASALFRIFEGHRTLVQAGNSGDIWDVILERVK